jgi:hypothetical protein
VIGRLDARNKWLALVLGPLLSLFLIGVMDVSCLPREAAYLIHSPDPSTLTTKVNVHLDVKFSASEDEAIDEALESWNVALNGYMRFREADRAFDMEVSQLRAPGVIIMRVDSQNEYVLHRTERVLGWTDAISGRLIWVVEDRMFNMDMLKGVVLHELGHSMGLPHLSKDSLMWAYDGGRSKCVDKETAVALVLLHQDWKLDHLNWCQ